MKRSKLYPLSKEDQELWDLFTSEFILEEDVFLESESFAELFEKPQEEKQTKPTIKTQSTLPKVEKNHAYDARTLENLQKGKLPIEQIIDLHGYKKHEAETYIQKRLRACYQSNQRIILIITGKGRFSKNGVSVLRQALPGWLTSSPLKEIVLSHRQARGKDGGSGAFYILLRKCL